MIDMYGLENPEKWDLEVIPVNCSMTREELNLLRVYSTGKDKERFLPGFRQQGGLVCQHNVLDDSIISNELRTWKCC